jgi:hypothetical protein
MTTSTVHEPAPERPATHPRWWHEIVLAGVFYLIYSQIRNFFGDGPQSRDIAFEHARNIIDLQARLGLWFEPALQQWYLGLPADGLIRWWNIFYGTAHFIVTIGVLFAAFRLAPERYRFLRTMLAGTTALALIGFAGYTLMPPRLLDVDTIHGACYGLGPNCNGYGMIDTIDVFGGLWSFGEGTMGSISNQYAAMPSLHIGWSMWSAVAMVVVHRTGWRRWLWFLYPAVTFFCILITANHFWLDALGGLAVLAGGALLAAGWERIRRPADGTPSADP